MYMYVVYYFFKNITTCSFKRKMFQQAGKKEKKNIKNYGIKSN